MTRDPFAGGQLGKERLVDATRGSCVEIFNDRVLSQVGVLETRYKPLALTLDSFAIDEQAEPFLERQPVDIALVTLFLERLCHAGKPKGNQFVVRGVGKHVSFLSCRPAKFVGRACEGGGRAYAGHDRAI
jgi:hypothetical protein